MMGVRAGKGTSRYVLGVRQRMSINNAHIASDEISCLMERLHGDMMGVANNKFCLLNELLKKIIFFFSFS